MSFTVPTTETSSFKLHLLMMF